MPNNRAKNYAVVDFCTNRQKAPNDAAISTGAKVFLLVNDNEIPVSQISLRYGLNAIPDATILIAMGHDADTGKPSAIYSQVASITQMAPLKIKIEGNLGDWNIGGTIKWPTAQPAAIIFTGYVSGLSYRRTSGRVSLVINAVNQLFDLAASAAGSVNIVPGAPADLLLPALFIGPGAAAAGAADAVFANALRLDVLTDFSKAVLNCLYYIANKDYILTQNKMMWCDPAQGDNTIKQIKNERALKVLKGDPAAEWLGMYNYFEVYKNNYPINLPSFVLDNAVASISTQISSSLASTSLWGILIEVIAAQFGCGVIPLANSAIFAPVLPMDRQHAIAIEPEDFVDFNFSCLSKRPLYGVGVISNYSFLNTTLLPRLAPCVGSSFVPDPAATGMWLFTQAPAWLDGYVNIDPARATNPEINKTLTQPSNSAVTGANTAQKTNRNIAEETAAYSTAQNQYAKMMYAANALNSREGILVGKLRFDVAPGTTIKIKSAGEFQKQGYPGVDELAESLFGFVARTIIMIDAEQSVASTSFELTNLRTESENKTNRFALDTHPFFDSHFQYAPLVKELSLATPAR